MEQKNDSQLSHMLRRNQNLNKLAYNKKATSHFVNRSKSDLFDVESSFDRAYDVKEANIRPKNAK